MSNEVRIIEATAAECHDAVLTSIVAKYPRIIHAEVMTHRDRARNAASSRAIPFPKMTEMVTTDTFVPWHIGASAKGMQAGEELPDVLKGLFSQLWRGAMQESVERATAMHHIGETGVRLGYIPKDSPYADATVHKSLVNRILEPYSYITVVMTATHWENFFRLRCHKDAERHFQDLACQIRDTLASNKPEKRPVGYWHLPFIQADERDHPIPYLADVSTARAARISYLTHLGVRDMSEDIRLFQTLCSGSGFGHWSPHEHVGVVNEGKQSGPFYGYTQYRKMFPNECAKEKWEV